MGIQAAKMSFGQIRDFLDPTTDYVFYKGLKSEFLGANSSAIKLIGLGTEKNILGRKDFDFFPERFAKHYVKGDSEVIQSKKTQIYLEMINFRNYRDSKPIVGIIKKSPLFDKKGQVCGVFGSIAPTTLNPKNEIFQTINHCEFGILQSKKIVTDFAKSIINAPNHILTKREQECLYYLLRGKSSTQVGRLLSISPRTVEEHTNNLKVKFAVSSKSDLIESAIDKGMVDVVPFSILEQQSESFP